MREVRTERKGEGGRERGGRACEVECEHECKKIFRQSVCDTPVRGTHTHTHTHTQPEQYRQRRYCITHTHNLSNVVRDDIAYVSVFHGYIPTLLLASIKLVVKLEVKQ